MINLFVHLSSYKNEAIYNKAWITVSLPVVPRIGDKVIMTNCQRKEIMSLLNRDKTPYYTDEDGNIWDWELVNIVSEVAHHADDGSIHLKLSYYHS